MNAKIQTQKDFKANFGVTITSNMGVKEVLEAFNRIEVDILDEASTVAMGSASKVYTTLAGARKLYVTQKLLTDGLKDAGENAVMGIYMPTVPASKAQDIILKGTEKVLDDLILSLPSKLIEGIKLK